MARPIALMTLAELELSAAPCHEPCHDWRQVRYDMRELRVDSSRWVMSTTTHLSPVSGVTERLADHSTFAVMSSRSLARVSAWPLLTAWPDVAAVRQVSACWWSRLLVRIGGAGASCALIARLLPLVARRRRVLLMVGWIIPDTG